MYLHSPYELFTPKPFHMNWLFSSLNKKKDRCDHPKTPEQPVLYWPDQPSLNLTHLSRKQRKKFKCNFLRKVTSELPSMSGFSLLYWVHYKINIYIIRSSTLPLKTFLLHILCKSGIVLRSENRWNIKVYHDKTLIL